MNAMLVMAILLSSDLPSRSGGVTYHPHLLATPVIVDQSMKVTVKAILMMRYRETRIACPIDVNPGTWRISAFRNDLQESLGWKSKRGVEYLPSYCYLRSHENGSSQFF